jgi:hypothetical protein
MISKKNNLLASIIKALIYLVAYCFVFKLTGFAFGTSECQLAYSYLSSWWALLLVSYVIECSFIEGGFCFLGMFLLAFVGDYWGVMPSHDAPITISGKLTFFLVPGIFWTLPVFISLGIRKLKKITAPHLDKIGIGFNDT